MKCLPMILLLFTFFTQFIVCTWQVQFRCPLVRLNNGKIRVRARGRIIRFHCFEGYTLVGNRYSTCVRGEWDTPIPVCVNAECPLPPQPNRTIMVKKFDGAILMFFCEVGYTLIGSSEIYCDGSRWNGTTPYCRSNYNASMPTPTKCDFEDPDLCGWRQDPTHDFDWKRHNFETPSLHIGTGPTHDHTLGAGNDGHYLYIEASGRLINDTARIISPVYPPLLTESGCFSFWYHMYGATIGSLNIYLRVEGPDEGQLIFTKSGNQGNQWFHGIFNLPHVNLDFQIVIEGVRGSSYVSDIAIDDVAILQGAQCIVKNETVNVTVSNDDQVEIVNAQQTCRDRCVFSPIPMESSNSITTVGPEICQCTIDCGERSSCCPDYAEYCILGLTTTVDSTTRSSGGKNTIVPVKNSTLTGFPINPKDDIDPGVSNSTISTTPQRSKLETKVSVRILTKKLPRTTVSVNTARQVETKETPFESKITLTTRQMDIRDRPDLHNVEQNPMKVKHSGSFEMLIIAIGATLTVLIVAFAIAIIVIRKRKIYKRGASGSALSEDSDVRFLTSDQILDFNLARPTDSDEM